MRQHEQYVKFSNHGGNSGRVVVRAGTNVVPYLWGAVVVCVLLVLL